MSLIYPTTIPPFSTSSNSKKHFNHPNSSDTTEDLDFLEQQYANSLSCIGNSCASNNSQYSSGKQSDTNTSINVAPNPIGQFLFALQSRAKEVVAQPVVSNNAMNTTANGGPINNNNNNGGNANATETNTANATDANRPTPQRPQAGTRTPPPPPPPTNPTAAATTAATRIIPPTPPSASPARPRITSAIIGNTRVRAGTDDVGIEGHISSPSRRRVDTRDSSNSYCDGDDVDIINETPSSSSSSDVDRRLDDGDVSDGLSSDDDYVSGSEVGSGSYETTFTGGVRRILGDDVDMDNATRNSDSTQELQTGRDGATPINGNGSEGDMDTQSDCDDDEGFEEFDESDGDDEIMM